MLEEILKVLSDDNQVAFVKGLNEKAQNVDTLTSKVNEYENKFNEAVQSRDKAKSKLSLVKDTFGLDEITAELLGELKNNKGQKGDEKLLAEIENYKAQIDTLNNGYQEKENNLVSQIRDLKLGSQLTDLINSSNIIDDQTARADALNIIKSQLSYDDNNNPIFRNEDGTTKFSGNGQAYSMNDAINDLISSRPYLAKPTTVNGGGATGNNSNQSNTLRRSEMSNTQKGEYIQQHGQEAYLKLAK